MPFSQWPQSAVFFEIFLWVVVVTCILFVWKGNIPFRVLGILGICGIIWGGIIEPFLLVVRINVIEERSLSGLRLGIISDIHVGPYVSMKKVKKIIDKLNKTRVDMVLIPGDFLHGKASDYADLLEPLSGLNMPFYVTLGNHDHRCDSGNAEPNILRQKLKYFGGMELNNSSLQIKKGIWLAGVDDNYLGFDNLDSAFSGIPEDAFVILLAHSPDIIRKKESQRASLIISGHTHGGQIRMPWGSIPIVIPAKEKKYDRGYFSEKKLLVTSGVGEVGTRIRFLNPPELRVVTFK